MMEDGFLGIDHVPFNYRLRDARMRMGWTRKRLAEEAHLDQSMVGQYESLKAWPVQAARERVATALKDDPEYLFPAEVGVALRGRTARTTTTVLPVETLTLGDPSMRLLAAPDSFEEVLDHQAREAIERALKRLKPRQRFVIRHHFGLGTEPKPFEEIGRMLGIGPAGARLHEVAGLTSLRKQRGRRQLAEWLWPRESSSRRDPVEYQEPVLRSVPR